MERTLVNMSKDTSTIVVRVGTAARQVIYSPTTKFLYGHSDNNKPGGLVRARIHRENDDAYLFAQSRTRRISQLVGLQAVAVWAATAGRHSTGVHLQVRWRRWRFAR